MSRNNSNKIDLRISKRFVTLVLMLAVGLTVLPAPAISADIEYAESEGESSTTAGSWQDKTTLTFTPDAQGDYLIVATAELKGSDAASSVLAQLDIDGTPHASLTAEPDEADIYIQHFATHRIVNLTAASHTLKIQYYDEAGMAYIRRARILAIPLSSFESNETETEDNVTSGSYTDIVTKSFTPASTQDYLLIASVEFDANDTGESIYIKSFIDATSMGELISEAQDTTDYLHYFAVKIQNLDTSSHTIKIQAKYETSSSQHVRRARVVAIPLTDNNLAQENAAAETYNPNSSDTPEDVTTLNFTPSVQADYYFLVSALGGGDASNGFANNTFADFEADGSETNSKQNGLQGDTDRLAFGAIRKINLTAASHTFKLRNWSGADADPDGGMGNARIIALVSAGDADGDLTVADHAVGQQGNKFVGSSTVADAQLFGFKLTNETVGSLTVDQVVFPLSSITGIDYDHYTDLKIYVDDDNDGEIEDGEDAQVGGSGVVAVVDPATDPTTITFNGNFAISASTTVNYILRGDVSNLALNDTVTIDLGTSNVTLTPAGDVGGSAATSVTHTYCGAGKFTYRRLITIDSDEVGRDGETGNLTDFPVLISLTGEWLKTPPTGDIESALGYDITFRQSDERTGLYHEIEEYDGTNGTLVAWVKIPSLIMDDGAENDTEIHMYYGNSCFSAPDDEYAEGVWDRDFVGVWHLEEAVTDDVTGGTHDDSTSNANDGAQSGNDDATGKIASGQDFDGGNDYISLEGQDISDHDYDAVTVSVWYKSTDSTVGRPVGGPDDEYIYNHSDSGWDEFVNLTVTDDGTDGRIRASAAVGGTYNDVYSTSTVINQQWHHVAMVRTGGGAGSRIKVYVDGDEETSAADSSGGGVINMVSTDNGPFIGDNPGDTEQVHGTLDEFRISTTARSADWIKTSFNNQVWPNKAVTPDPDPSPNPGSGFITVGNEDTGFATAVTLLSFTATGRDGSVLVTWETAQEIGNMGFYLYRSESPAGPYTLITDKLIPGLISSVMGKAYTFDDPDLKQGRLYYYKLEDIDIYGTDPLNPDTDGDGIPDGQESFKNVRDISGKMRTLSKGVQVIAADETGLTLELRTDAFDAEALQYEGEAFERLRIPAYIHGFTQDIGKPELPMKGLFLDLPEGKTATLTVETTETETHDGYWVYPVPEKEAQETDSLAHVGEVFAMDEAAYTTDALYPEAVALTGDTYTFRDQQKLRVMFSPLAFNPGHRLAYAPHPHPGAD